MESERTLEPLGIIAAESEPFHFSFLARRPVKVGEYVTAEAPEGGILGLVEGSIIKSSLMQLATNFQAAVEAREVAAKNPRDKNNVASVKVLGLVDYLKRGMLFMPSLPPEPGAEVKEALASELSGIFSKDSKEWVRIGKLLRSDQVSVSINVNKIASRHLAILAATGSGKSNLLALIAKRMAELNGTMIIFDYQGEYSELKIRNIVHIQAKVNPRILDVEKLADMLDISEKASKQRSILSRAFTSEVKQTKDFWDALKYELNNISGNGEASSDDRRVTQRVLEIVERARRRKGRVLDPEIGDPIDQIKPNNVNVLNMLESTLCLLASTFDFLLEVYLLIFASNQ